MTDDPAWDHGLAPAARKRSGRAAPAPPAGVPVERIEELEREVRALRGELARSHERIEALLARQHASPAVDDDLRDVLSTLQSDVALMGSRLSTLLGGPTLTELLDRIDELADRVGQADTGRRRRKL